MRTMFTVLFISLFVLSISMPVFAQPSVLHPSGLPLPRFASLKSDKVNMRVGPGKRYPIQWVYSRKDLPVEITEEFAHWRKIRDPDGSEGWIHKNLLSGKRTAMVMEGTQALHKKPDESSRPVVRMKQGFIGIVTLCQPDWCHMKAGGYEGWVNKADIWGAYRQEVFEKK